MNAPRTDAPARPLEVGIPNAELQQRLMAEARHMRAEALAAMFRGLWRMLTRPAGGHRVASRQAHA